MPDPDPPIDLEALARTPLRRDPYDHVVVANFVRGAALAAINRDFPAIDRPGSFPLSELRPGAAFTALIETLAGPDFRARVGDKFGLDLAPYPLTCTVRGRCRIKDGRIHTDTAAKILTVLIYLNPDWPARGGRLRLLRGGHDLNDWVHEVVPQGGAMVIFRRSDRSWHGHAPFAGERRSIQLNWVTSQAVADRELARHRRSARLKRLLPFG